MTRWNRTWPLFSGVAAAGLGGAIFFGSLVRAGEAGRATGPASAPATSTAPAGQTLQGRLAWTLPRLEFKGIALGDCLEFLREVGNVNIVCDPDCAKELDKQIDLQVKGMSIEQVISLTARLADVKHRLQDGAVYVYKAAELNKIALAPLRQDAPAWERALREKMDKVVPKIEFVSVPLADILQYLRDVGGVNIVTKADLTALVSFKAKDLTFQQVLNLLAQMHRLTYGLADDAVVIEPLKGASPARP